MICSRCNANDITLDVTKGDVLKFMCRQCNIDHTQTILKWAKIPKTLTLESLDERLTKLENNK